MTVARWGVSLVGVIGLGAGAIAAAVIWLAISNPVTVANAVSTGDLGPVVAAIGKVIVDALNGLFKYSVEIAGSGFGVPGFRLSSSARGLALSDVEGLEPGTCEPLSPIGS